MRTFIDRLDGNQPGDPAKAAAACLPLGDDAVGFIRDKLRARLAELDRVQAVGSNGQAAVGIAGGRRRARRLGSIQGGG